MGYFPFGSVGCFIIGEINVHFSTNQIEINLISKKQQFLHFCAAIVQPVTIFGSSFTLVAISVERYTAIRLDTRNLMIK